MTFIGFFSEFHRGQSQVLQGDMFLPAMRDFQAQATCRLAEAEDLFQDMKTRVSFEISCHRQPLFHLLKFLWIVRSGSKALWWRFGRRSARWVLRHFRKLPTSISRSQTRCRKYEKEDRRGRTEGKAGARGT